MRTTAGGSLAGSSAGSSTGSSTDGGSSSSTDGGSSSSTDGGSSSGTGDPATLCEGYGALIANCYYGGDPTIEAMATAYCENYESYLVATYGPACGAAFEDVLVCINALTCMELPMFGNPGFCDGELSVFDMTCV
ncbi:MAG: hypothetical protein KDK70_12580 [Myxococcales bacterium]|nr:hypothetical protein [Myxococcales bacterium]